MESQIWRHALPDRVSRSDVPRVEPSDAKRLRVLEDENSKLKKLLAEQMLDNAMLRDINSKNGDARWEAVAHLMEVHQVSQRRACKVLQIDRSSVRYLLRRGDDAALRDALKRVSRERRRFGCRRVHVMVAREGCAVNYYPAMHIYMHDREQEDEAHLYRREDVVSDALPPLGILLRYILPGNGRTSFPHLGGC